MLKKFIVDKDYHNSRFDKWFKQNVFNIPQSLIEKIIRKNKVKVNKKKTKTSYRVQFHDIIEIYGINKIKSNDKSKKIKYKPSEKEKSKYDNFILENNNNFIIINKPSGIPVQAGTRSFKNIIDILKNTKYFKDVKPFIVHRLDKETSGVLIVAKNREYAQLFTSLFRIRKIHKTYLAITYGEVSEDISLLEDDLISYDNNKKIVQKAISHLKILKSNGQYSLLELNPITGRKHQLRKQLYNIGNPIIGDNKYFVKKHINKIRSKNLMLHAHKIKFMINNVKYNFKAKYNEEFEDFIKRKF
ncbi:MAG: RNA pseudouridine synthase [Pelagibacteraceae bacterium]|nr:RNA pseudouridine synthase [Pelagibacteraceae bacterium]MBO6484563.1 RNA pseudouridine synthase [Pelagibacteraceae bacterium]